MVWWASRYRDCRDCWRSWAIAVTSPYRPQRTAKALAMRCGIVGMETRSVEVDQGITPTIAHAPKRIVHGLRPTNTGLEKVPRDLSAALALPTQLLTAGHPK